MDVCGTPNTIALSPSMIPPTLVQPSFRSRKPQNIAHFSPTVFFIFAILFRVFFGFKNPILYCISNIYKKHTSLSPPSRLLINFEAAKVLFFLKYRRGRRIGR
jgi:hypothetical protein